MASKDGFFKENAFSGLARLVVVAALLIGPAAASEQSSSPKTAAKAPTQTHKVTTPAERCAALERQFDAALLKDAQAHNLSSAKKLRAEGAHLCEAGKHALGALRLSTALADLGLQAKEP